MTTAMRAVGAANPIHASRGPSTTSAPPLAQTPHPPRRRAITRGSGTDPPFDISTPLGHLTYRSVSMSQAAQNLDPAPEEGNLASRILRESMQLFAAHGYAGTSIRQVVEAAGCTKPALYYHFENKQQLFLRAVDAACAELDVIESVAERGGSVREQMLVGFRALRAKVQARPEALRLLLRAEMHQQEGQPRLDFRSFRARDLVRIETKLRQGVESGELRPDLDVHDAAIALVGTTHLHLHLWLDGTPLPPDFADRVVALFFKGLER